jgi:hypothetical protein
VQPLVIAGQGHFFTGMREVTTDFGVSVTGTHAEYQSPRFSGERENKAWAK